jgi:shikimate kinase/3-dehydroquinate synthase
VAGAGAVKVFLVGMMGSGKTTVGRALAARLGSPFFDADEEIERAEGRTIARIFEESGEARFRELEREAVRRLALREGDTVVALGGGAVLDAGTRALLGECGKTVWLTLGPDRLMDRLQDAADRPLLAGLDVAARRARLDEIWCQRKPLYASVADLGIDPHDASAADVAGWIAGWLTGARAVRVDLGPRSYDVLVEDVGVRVGWAMRRAGLAPGRCALVVDEKLVGTWEHDLRRALHQAGFTPTLFPIPRGEDAKRIAVVERLLDAFAEARLERGAPVVALGGGATTDVAGFAAAIYLRGVPWVAVPTTLLGMVDAAIGGKTGVNLAAGKNLAGAFWQPRLVLADPKFLGTLPTRELASGLGEVAKYALIGPEDLFAAVEAQLPAIEAARGAEDPVRREAFVPSTDLIARCVAVKAAVVAADERETGGRRKVLNFGHTIGHALEAAAGFGTLAHGEAVLLGMRAAIFLSRRKGLLAADEAERLLAFLAGFPAPPLPPECRGEAPLQFLLADKKVVGGKLLFVLLRARGDPVVDVEVSREDALAALAFLRGGGAP